MSLGGRQDAGGRDPERVFFSISTSESGRTRQFSTSARALRAFLVVGALVVIGLLAGGAWLIRLAGDAGNVRSLAALGDSLRNTSAQLRQLEDHVAILEDANRKMRELAGLETPEDEAEAARYEGDPDPNVGRSREPAWSPSAPTRIPHRGPVSRGFNPGEEDRPRHLGVDIPGPVGAPILAAGAGIATRVTEDAVFGKVITLDHGNGLESLYGHNDELLVSVGDTVHAGQLIARLGNTGQSSAPHLHFEIRKDGISIDPRQFVPGDWAP